MNVVKMALYRKYRPENFDQVVGQEQVIRVLKNAVKENMISHAYLFSGPRGTGKTSVARILAKSVNCEKRTGYNPCGRCSSCINIKEGKTMDLLEIDAASNRGIDEIRDLREKIKFAPTDSLYKVFIIDEVHMLTKEAFNALLKTLEEPPEHAIFVLATTEIHKVPNTIISRCQRHDFRRIKMSEIVSTIIDIAKKEKVKVEDEALEMIAEASEGGLRDAISILDQIASVGLPVVTANDVEETLGLTPHKTIYGFIKALIDYQVTDALKILDSLERNGSDVVIFAKTVQEYVSKLVTAKMGNVESLEGTSEQIEELKELASKVSTEQIISISAALMETQGNFRSGVNPAFAMTMVCFYGEEKQPETTMQVQGKAKEAKEPKPSAGELKEAKSEPAPQDKRTNGQWNHFLMELKSKNNTIHAFMRVAVPVFEEERLILTFPYKFHKERLEESKNRMMVENIITKVYGKPYQVVCMLETNGNGVKLESTESAASILGGEVMDEK
jgi:DNA polymerase-3 subunit gamma/tau